MKLRTAAALGYLTFAAAMRAQAPDPPAPDTTNAPTTLSTRSTLVVVPALVRNKARGGELVFTLKVNDFALTDNGVPQKLTLEQDTGGEPLALVVAIEGGGAGTRELDKYRGLAAMIETVVGNVPHKVAIVGFDSSPVLVQDFTPDTDVAARGVQALIDDDSGDGKDAILDSIGFSVDLLRKQPPQYRRAILLVSETVDHGSKMKMEEALRAISDTNTAIYSVAFSTGGSDASAVWSDMKSAPPSGGLTLMPEVQLAEMAILRVIDGLHRNVPETVARLTGGEYFPLGNEKSLGRDLQAIANHIPNRYVLSFQPQSPRPGFHSIKLTVPNYEKLEVSARDGYWAEGDPAAASQTGNPPPTTH
jgi:VWFA-related protein